mmetsp:Transcript_2462/g.5730  ORF Transcript_2462/g.5730 Transcript_2462/m.5730 type:complete len:458 (-) Transcript_2462:529-1902(-)
MTFFSKAVSKVLPLSCSCSCNKNDPDRISQTNNEKNNHRNVIANGNQQTRSHTHSHSHSYTHNHSTTEKEPQNRHHPKKKLIKKNSNKNNNNNNKPAKKLLSSLWSKNQNQNHTKDAGNPNLLSSLPPCLSAEDLRAGTNPNTNTNTNTNTDSSHCTTVPNSPSPVVDRSILHPRELLLPVTAVPSLSVPGMPDCDENANANGNANGNGNGEQEPCGELRPRPDAMPDSSSLDNDSPSSNSYNEYSFCYPVDETTTDEEDAPPVPIVWVPEGFVLEPAAKAAKCRTYHLLDGPPPLPLASSARKLGTGTARNKDSDRNRNRDYNQDTDEHWDDQTIATQQSQQHCEPLQEPNSESNSDPTPNETPNPNHTLIQTPTRKEPPTANPDRRLLELAARKVLVAALYQQRPRPVRMPMERPGHVPGGDSESGDGSSSSSGSSVERGPPRPQRVVRWHVVAN